MNSKIIDTTFSNSESISATEILENIKNIKRILELDNPILSKFEPFGNVPIINPISHMPVPFSNTIKFSPYLVKNYIIHTKEYPKRKKKNKRWRKKWAKRYMIRYSEPLKEILCFKRSDGYVEMFAHPELKSTIESIIKDINKTIDRKVIDDFSTWPSFGTYGVKNEPPIYKIDS